MLTTYCEIIIAFGFCRRYTRGYLHFHIWFPAIFRRSSVVNGIYHYLDGWICLVLLREGSGEYSFDVFKA